MSAEWFYQLDGVQVGPMTSDDLKRHVAAGRIQSNTLIRRGQDGKWYSAIKVQGLLPPEPTLVKETSQDQIDFPLDKPASSETIISRRTGSSGPKKSEATILWVVGLGLTLLVVVAILFLNQPKPGIKNQSTSLSSTSTSTPDLVRVSSVVETDADRAKKEFEKIFKQIEPKCHGVVDYVYSYRLKVPDFSKKWSRRKISCLGCRYDIKHTDSVVTPYKAILYINKMTGDGVSEQNSVAFESEEEASKSNVKFRSPSELGYPFLWNGNAWESDDPDHKDALLWPDGWVYGGMYLRDRQEPDFKEIERQ